MSSIIKVDTVQDQDGNNIINENANVITVGASGDTITIPAGATFDSSAATNTLPATVVTTTGTQTLTNKNIVASQLTGTVATSNLGTGTADATTFLRGDQTYAEAGGGLVLQVVQGVKSDTFTSTAFNTWTAITGLSASITPSSASSKIFVLSNVNGFAGNNSHIRLYRDSIGIFDGDPPVAARIEATAGSMRNGGDNNSIINNAISYIDSPATTSAITYSIKFWLHNSQTFYINRSANDTNASYTARTASNIILMEVAG